jgi:hypothetical protein
LNGIVSFGERAARRIEAEYGLGNGYLDMADGISSLDESDSEKAIRTQLIETINMRLNTMSLAKIRAIEALTEESY